MDKQQLLELQKMSMLTPAAIEVQKPALFDQLRTVAADNLKSTVMLRLKNANEQIRETVGKIDFSDKNLLLKDLRAVLSDHITASNLDEAKKKELTEVAAKLPDLGKLGDQLQPDVPIFVNPVFQDQLYKAKVYRLSDVAQLSQDVTDKIIATSAAFYSISDSQLQELVSSNILDSKQATDLGFVSNLYTFLDANFELTEAAKKIAGIERIEDMVNLDKNKWVGIIRESHAALPPGVNEEEYAAILVKKAAQLFPEVVLAQKLPAPKSEMLTAQLDMLKPLLDKNEKVFGASSFDSLKMDGIDPEQQKTLKSNFQDLQKLANVYPGLELNFVLNDRQLSPAEKATTVAARISVLENFMKKNADASLLALDYRHDSTDLVQLNFEGFNDKDKGMLVKSLKAYQRVYSFTQDIDNTQAVMAAGFHSSFQVASVTLPEFVRATGLEPSVAKDYYEHASGGIIRTTGIMGSIVDIVNGVFDKTHVGNSNPEINDYLRKIPGYQDLFGELTFCDCSDCQSIYSPAAYFVDLMQLVEKNIISKHFAGSKANHVLNLKVRRPGLWTLPLTCENTSTLVPYLDIINEILETYIAKSKGFSGVLSDRAAVESFVYKDQIALEGVPAWKNQLHAFSQPYLLPLEAVAVYLSHFEKTREDVALLLQKPQATVSTTRLDLSDKELTLITTADADPGFLQKIYGLTFSITAGKITAFRAQDLLKPMGVDRKELGRLFKTSFITANGSDNIVLQGEKTSADSVQNDIERVHNLTYDVLDRAHRFVRLWRKTSWTIEELDFVLTQIKAAGIAAGLNPDALTCIGNLLRLQEKTKTTVEQMSGLWYNIPTSRLMVVESPGILNNKTFDELSETDNELNKTYFDRLFNHDDVIKTEGSYPKDNIVLIHPGLAIDRSTPNAEFSSARLMAAMNRGDDEVLTLIKNLAPLLGIVSPTSGAESQRGFKLTLPNLSVIYRHSKLADLLQLPVAEFFRLLKLTPGIPHPYLENIDQIYIFLGFYDWWKTTHFTIDELNFIIEAGDIALPDNFKTKEAVSSALLTQIKAKNALVFAATVFATFPDITETQSKDIKSANMAVIEPAPDTDHFRLKSAYNPSVALNVPAGITRPEAELRALLNKFHPQYLVPYFLSGSLGLPESILGKMATLLAVDFDTDAFANELNGTLTPAVALPAFIEKLLPLSVLFRDKKFSVDVLAYILDHLPVFGIVNLDQVSIGAIQRIQGFVGLIKTDDDGQTNVNVLTDVVDAYSNATQYSTADQEKLGLLLGIASEMLPGLHPLVAGSVNAIDALLRYQELATFCSYLGIGGDVLPKILSQAYVELDEATNGLLAAFRSKYKSEQERKEKLEKYQDKLRGRKRASLTTFLTHSGYPQFDKPDDLFHYFLIDTELEGCARTSRLVAATMSLQLYIHRILLNLEQDNQEPGTPGRINLGINPDNPADKEYEPIPVDEWEWRKNYRVWEANRKVFLYPENYIEPELRDDKTPLFKELENELLQQEINQDTVLDAYGKFMRGFDEVAHLKIAGSYYERDASTQTDVLHLFGVTADEPPVYYYRRVENLYYAEKRDDRGVVWLPWEKINVQIPVRTVAPVTFNGRVHVFWVKVTTLGNTVFEDNRSVFVGYSHKFSIEFTTLKLDGTWAPPQKLNLKDVYPFEGNGVVQDPLADEYEIGNLRNELINLLKSFPFFNLSGLNAAQTALKTPRYDTVAHFEARDEYTLSGFMWDQIYPYADSSGRLILTGMGYQMRAALDFYNLNMQTMGVNVKNITNSTDPVQEVLTIVKNRAGKIIERAGNTLYRATSPGTQPFDNYAYGALITNTTSSDPMLQRHWLASSVKAAFDNIRNEQIASLRSGSNVDIINGAYSDAVVDVNGDLLLLQGTPIAGSGFVLRRLGTTLSETLTRTLFTSGVDTTLDIETQKKLKEAVAPITITANRIQNLVVSDRIDFKGAYGTYFREVFFHIPFLIANHLNSQGKYADAQKWYHYIFNPGANEVISFPAGATAAQKKKMEMDRNWQYLEFREIGIQKLRDQLNDKQAIEVYKKDPFNPHAIARLRLSAYQKCIVMKYIDNLLDWADDLFTQDTMESVNQATLLYIIAKEILGDRPVEIGDCGNATAAPKTYENIQPSLAQGSEFLMELETYTIVKTPGKTPIKKRQFAIDNQLIRASTKQVAQMMSKSTYAMYGTEMQVNEVNELVNLREKYMPKVTIKPVDDEVTGAFANGNIKSLDWKKASHYRKDMTRIPSFGWSIVRHVSPVFCIPGNGDLLGYFDRVDDCLYKIRNCMNIRGEKRQLDLFAPEIDPRLLVRGKAAGISLDDILSSVNGNVPPYRFAYILEKAKAFTGVVQSFGASLLGAIEKKNGEELSMIRLAQQQNILEISYKSRQMEIDSANENINVLNDRIESLNYQLGYYDSLIDERTNGWEKAQEGGRHTASIVNGIAIPLWNLNGVFGLIPQIGSPFAMKYGGQELSNSVRGFAEGIRSLAMVGENLAASAGLEAGFDRRTEGWKHQRQMLRYELKEAKMNLKILEIRRDLAIDAQKLHEKNIQHNQDVIDFYGDKFSNLGLYTWLSSTMQQTYKEAFNNALAIARLAERAYRYERDESTQFIDSGYFDASRGGLLAGERLLLALQQMERRYLETNYRKNEIDQAFSIAQIDPAALFQLKQTGTCEFFLSELYFDLFYPGQYRRKIQSVRLTIPSVTGPYTNVSATLSLRSSLVRMETKTGPAELKTVPASRTTSIATSTAQNDAGVFQLNFRDDRYMPFEGAGAISSWKLTLPKNFRQFDYNTINDVIIHVSYTAEYDELFRDKVEKSNGELEAMLKADPAPLRRMISLRQEFSSDFHRLTAFPLNTAVPFTIQNRHFPLFMNGRTLRITKSSLVLVTPSGQTAAGVNISLNAVPQTGFAADAAFGNAYSKDLGANFFNGGIMNDHTFIVIAAGDLAPSAGNAALDTEKLLDILVYLEYKIG